MEGSNGPSMPKFDMSKMSMGEKLTLGGAALFFLSAFIFKWYTVGSGLIQISVHGRTGINWVPILLALAAVVEIVARTAMGKSFLPNPKQTHLAIATVSFVIMVIRIFWKPSSGFAGVDVSLAFGFFISLILSGVWAYGALTMSGKKLGDMKMPMGGGDS